MPPSTLNGKQAEHWLNKFAQQSGIADTIEQPLEQVIQLLERELPVRFTEAQFHSVKKFDKSHEWINSVLLGKQKLSISEEQQQDFKLHLLDLSASIDELVSLPDLDGRPIKIAIDVTVNPRQEQSKLNKITGLPDRRDPGKSNRNKNISKVRKALGIDKHLVLTVQSERHLLPSYRTLLSELQAFAQGPSITGNLNLRELQPEQTISGAYHQLASRYPLLKGEERLTAIANLSIDQGHHPSYTTQILLNDPAIQRIDTLDRAREISAQFATRAFSRTTHYQIVASIEDILKNQGRKANNAITAELGDLQLKKDSSGYSIYDKAGRGLVYHGDRFKIKVSKLEKAETLRFLNYYNRVIQKNTRQQRNRGHRRR